MQCFAKSYICTLSLPLVFFLSSTTQAVDVTFTLDDQQSSLTINASTSLLIFTFTDEDTQNLQGTLNTSLDFGNLGTLPQTADFVVHGGAISPLSPFNLTLGNFLASVNVAINDAVATVTTPSPPATLTQLPTGALRYQFDAANFDITLNQGTVVTTGAVNQSVNLADMPVTGTPEPNTFGTITLTSFQQMGSQTTDDALLQLPIDFTEIVDFDGQLVTLDVTGQIIATSNFTVGTAADLNNDGNVDGADFVQIQRDDPSLVTPWQFDYGTVSSQVAVLQVPEPSMALFLLAACVAGAVRQRTT